MVALGCAASAAAACQSEPEGEADGGSGEVTERREVRQPGRPPDVGASGSATSTWTVGASGTAYQLPLANPGAETGSCGSGGGGYPAQGWTATSSQPQRVCYGAPSYPTAAQGPKAPATPGTAFFDGGPTRTRR
jgi:hypothetical protein